MLTYSYSLRMSSITSHRIALGRLPRYHFSRTLPGFPLIIGVYPPALFHITVTLVKLLLLFYLLVKFVCVYFAGLSAMYEILLFYNCCLLLSKEVQRIFLQFV